MTKELWKISRHIWLEKLGSRMEMEMRDFYSNYLVEGSPIPIPILEGNENGMEMPQVPKIQSLLSPSIQTLFWFQL